MTGTKLVGCMQVPIFRLSGLERWVGPSSGVKNHRSLGLTSAAAPEKSLLPRDGSVLLAFGSWHPRLKLTVEKPNHSCLGWAWQRLRKKLLQSSSETRQGWKKGRGGRRKKQNCLGQKR